MTPQNKQRIDQAFHRVTGVEYKECPVTWRNLKQDWLANLEKKQELARKLK